jgi:hypothetical protein
MHDAFRNQRRSAATTSSHAQEIAEDAFEQCMANAKYADAIKKDLAEAARLQVSARRPFHRRDGRERGDEGDPTGRRPALLAFKAAIDAARRGEARGSGRE